MADPLTSKSDKDDIQARIIYLLTTGITLKSACKKIETGQKAATTKKQFQRHGSGALIRHGHCKLSIEQEGILFSMVVVYSLMHEGLKPSELAEHVEAAFGLQLEKLGKLLPPEAQ